MSDVNVTIGADTSQFAAGMATIRNEARSVGQSIQSSLAGYLSPAALISTALTVGLGKLLENIHEIHHQSERFRVDAESLQLIANAAKEDGIGLEQTARSLNLLTINAQKALNPMSEQAKAANELRINIEAFAAANPANQFLMLADAYNASAKGGAEYAAVAALIGKRNTEMVTVLEKGSAKIRADGEAMGIIAKENVKDIDAMYVALKQAGNQFEVLAAKGVASLKTLDDWFKRTGQNAQEFWNKSHGVAQDWTTGVGHIGGNIPPKEGTGIPGVDNFASFLPDLEKISELEDELAAKRQKNWLAAMADEEKLVELYQERQAIVDQLNQADAQGNLSDEERLNLQVQIEDITSQILPVETRVANEKERAADAAARDAEETERAAEATQREADAAAQRAQIAADAAEQERVQSFHGPHPLTVSALAEGNLRLGATSEVYAQALAASRGIKQGTPAYDRLLQQITAQDQLRNLRGENLSFADQAARDKLVQWFAARQQQQASATSATTHNAMIDYWTAIASGRPPSSVNPSAAFFGGMSTNLTPEQANAAQIQQLSQQIDLQQQQLNALQQIVVNTTIVQVG